MFYKTINKKGFTLMELIVTVILVAILASYAVYHYTNVMDEGRLNGAKGKLAALGGSTARFILEHGAPAMTGDVAIDSSVVSGSCNHGEIKGVFTCGYAEKNVGFDDNFNFAFSDHPCGLVTNYITAMMTPKQDNDIFPDCVYFNPNVDAVVEVN